MPILNKWEYEPLTGKNEYRAVMGFENPETVSSVKFALRDDNTDWQWFNGIFDGNDRWYYDIHTKELDFKGTIYCHAYVQGKNGFYQGYPYQEIKMINTILGDANGNGKVDITDATVIQRYLTGLSVFYPDETLMNADVDGDGVLTILDATFIQRHVTKINTPYPIGEPKT